MEKKNKDLLLKVLCDGLPYGVMVNVEGYGTEKLIGIENETITTKTTFDLMVDKEKVVHVVIVVVIKKHIIVVISSVSIFCLGFCSRNPSNPGTSRHSLACRPA